MVTKEQCEQNPDLVNDFFGMAMRYIRYNKSLFFKSNALEIFVNFMMRCIGLERYRAAKAHSEFMN
jgi:transportin-3